MRTTLADRIKGIFARDKFAYWFDHFTDEEKQLRRMDVWQLAKVINEARVRNLVDDCEKRIVAEHMLNMRLAKIQAKASWGSGVLGFVGAIIGSALSVSLTIALQNPKETPSAPERTSEKQSVSVPVQKQREPIVPPLKNIPSNPVLEATSDTQSTVNGTRNSTETKQPNASAKP